MHFFSLNSLIIKYVVKDGHWYVHVLHYPSPTSDTSVNQVAKPTVPITGSTIPTVVGRNVMPRMSSPNTSSSDLTNGLNGAAPKRPHSPSLEEPHKKLKDTEQVNRPLKTVWMDVGHFVHCDIQMHDALVRFSLVYHSSAICIVHLFKRI